MEKNVSKVRFIVPSVVGIFLFMIPIKVDGSWTIAVKIIADWISAIAESILPGLCLFILTVSAVLCLMAFAKPKFIMGNTLLKEAFCCTPFWAATRVLGCIFCWLAYFSLGNEQGLGFAKFIGAITGPDQGGMALGLIVGLVIIFLIASFLLPLLLDFGLLEFVGALLTKFMRPLFQVPGRAAVDCITSWIGDGTLGVMLTCNQYEGGYYSTKEASIISTCFSAVSITFSMVVLAQVDLTQYFGIYYLIICLIGIVCAVICPRIYPLRKKPNDYLIPGKAMPETLPEGFTSSKEYGLHLAMKRAAAHKGAGEFFRNGAKNCLNMWFGVLPTVMCIGTVALVVANYTPVFDWLGMPFRPLLSALQVPDVTATASTMVVGFTDMFTPSVIIAGTNAVPMTRFIVAVVSVTQVLFLDEVGGLILSSKLPINLFELFVIFLERTIISLAIVCPIAHLLF